MIATSSGISGILNVNKPAGLTSHDVVVRVRSLTGQQRVGHAGTLDPMATGVLLLCLGQATRVAEYLMAGQKHYRAVIRLGASTDTYDAEGRVVSSVETFRLSREQIAGALTAFQGAIQQVPPPYSAIRRKGQRLYELARRGIHLQVPPRTVEISQIELLAWEPPDVSLRVVCSPGTYVRSLANDLGGALGVGGHLAALTRLASGHWRVSEAVGLDKLEAAIKAGDWLHLLQPIDAALVDFQRVDLPTELAHQVSQGQTVRLDCQPETSLARAYTPGGDLVAILKPSPGASNLWQPKKVFISPTTIC